MRRGRRDSTHAAIRDGLRTCGVTVHDTADLGRDFPDLVCGYRQRTYLLECKAPKGKESGGQTEARTAWRGGPWIVVHSLDEALAAIGMRTSTEQIKEMVGVTAD